MEIYGLRKMSCERTEFRAKVLVVDDEPDLLELLVDELRDAGYDVEMASSGNQAISRLARTNVDVVISDVRMPDGSGVDLLEQIQRRGDGRPKLIFATGYSDRKIVELLDKGAEAVFLKPLDLDALRKVVASLVTPKDENWLRGKERVTCDFPAHFFSIDQNGSDARVVNLSLSGAFFEVPFVELLPADGGRVEFKIFSPPSRTLRVSGSGIVRWRRLEAGGNQPLGFGLQFVFLGPESRQALSLLINEVRTKSQVAGQNQ